MHPIAYYRTITRHRHLVCRYCMRLGLVYQGLTHDLSNTHRWSFGTAPAITRGPGAPTTWSGKPPVCPRPGSITRGRNRHHLSTRAHYGAAAGRKDHLRRKPHAHEV